ncbi:RNA polymerase III Rpc82 [Macleaya cordata]|uniref:DNA-directed RNA polymerase III subunit RPC3 n=1 Tax=Macleaya cordata TaxID=56857 RepID=A0A200PQ24_MACCD|nr:RNA polymerase III Rpc82 [Macleaya cordata]
MKENLPLCWWHITILLVEEETVEQRAITVAAPSDGERFAIVIDSGTDVTAEAKSEGNPSTSIGEKRKHEALEMDREAMATICEKEVLWRANFEEFVRHLRHEACVANVRTRLDDGAVTVLNAMLDGTRRAEKKVKTENSVPLSMDAILEEVIKSEEGRSMTLEHVRAALVQLGCHSSTRGTEEGYSVDLKNIIEIAQNDEVESIVLKRYGKDAYRIYRLLSKADSLAETDKIADTTFVDKKETLKILYKMWKDDYLHMEKIVLHGSTQAQFLLWKVNRHCLWEGILDEMRHAALNLSQRMAYELEQEHDMLGQPSQILQLPREKRVGELGKRFERTRKVKILLESSLMKLDDALMLFHDF